MKISRYLYAAAILAALLLALGIWNPFPNVAKADRPHVPRFVVDPFYPKPLPDKWVTGEVAGTCIDSKDHLITVNRGNLISPETLVATAAPPVIEFDKEGNVVRAWGDRNILPNGIHGCFVDYQDNIWIAGNGDGIVQKYSHDGSLLMQIGTRGTCDSPTGVCGNPGSNSSTLLLNQPADIAVDPSNGEIYIADGYGNHRIVVFASNGAYLRQWGNSGTGPGQFQPADGGHPHCVVLGNDGLVYTCDRGSDRIQVFEKNPTNCTGSVPDRVCPPVRIIPVVPCTGVSGSAVCPGTALGTAGSAWDLDFSADKKQKEMYEADGGNEVVWFFDRESAMKGVWPSSILGGFGRSGHQAGEFTYLHSLAVDSKGNLYTGETINGRRIQRFKPEGNVPEKDLEVLHPNGSPNLSLEHYDPVK
jgi:hypothetical protein